MGGGGWGGTDRPVKIKGRACQHPLSPQLALINPFFPNCRLLRFRLGRNRENVSFLISALKDTKEKKSVHVIKCNKMLNALK